MIITAHASGSAGNCYTIDDGHTKILLEAGASAEQIQRWTDHKLSQYSACFISHEHGDHSKGAAGLTNKGLDVYGPCGIISTGKSCAHRVHVFNAGDNITIGTLRVHAWAAIHDVPNNGLYIQSKNTGANLVFATDTQAIPHAFPEATHLMVEANYSKDIIAGMIAMGKLPRYRYGRIYAGHMSIEELLAYIKATDMEQIREIYLLHLSDANSNAEHFRRIIARETGAAVFVC